MERPRPSVRGTLGVFAPSSPFDPERFERGLAILATLGFRTKLHPQVTAKNGFLAGTDAERAAALDALLDDDDVDAIIAARGGYGVHRLLHLVDPAHIRRAAKPIVGFSDVTALHALVQGKAGLESIHGPVVTQLASLGPEDHAALVDALAGRYGALAYTSDRTPVHAGRATGVLTGGCLSVLTPLVGTDLLFVPDGAILLLEDVGEAPYRVDRMLTHLRLAGVLDRVAGVAVGDFVGCETQRPGEQSIDDVLAERLGDLGVPVLTGLPFGHGARNRAIPLGATATLDATAGRLVLAEHAGGSLA
ncbi:LD-carboxypeptidase [Myxococcota bacterium]|nr:LD-carboxypeptidase [Myxococcota bacterium]